MGKKIDGSSPTTVAGWKVGTRLDYEDYDGGRIPNFLGATGFSPEWLMKFIQYEVLKYYPDQDWRDWETQFLRKTDFHMSFEGIDPLTAKEIGYLGGSRKVEPLNLYTAFNQLDVGSGDIGIEFRFLTYAATSYSKQAAIYFQIRDGWISPTEILIGDREGRSHSYAPPYELNIKLPWVQNDAADSLMEGNLIMKVRKGFLYWSINQSQKAKIVDKRQST